MLSVTSEKENLLHRAAAADLQLRCGRPVSVYGQLNGVHSGTGCCADPVATVSVIVHHLRGETQRVDGSASLFWTVFSTVRMY